MKISSSSEGVCDPRTPVRALTGLVFWSPGFLFTWVFDAFFQMTRYPLGLSGVIAARYSRIWRKVRLLRRSVATQK